MKNMNEKIFHVGKYGSIIEGMLFMEPGGFNMIELDDGQMVRIGFLDNYNNLYDALKSGFLKFE